MLERLKTIVVNAFPELAQAQFSLLAMGWDSVAVDVDDCLIFKFPRHRAAEKALRREAKLLAFLRPALTMPVPDLRLLPGPPLFSRHEKLQGGHLVTADYDLLAESDRQRLARQMARFYAELHDLDPVELRAAGAVPIKPWRTTEELRAKAFPALPAELRPHAERTVGRLEEMGPDPYGTPYGFFDGHGWNMAFDHARGTLTGIYDFADSGFGPLHQEFIYTSFISPDLTARIVAEYEVLTGRQLDRERIKVLTGTHRLSELAELVDDPEHVSAMVRNAAEWLALSG